MIAIVGLLFGVNPLQLLGMIEGGGSGAPTSAPSQTMPAPGYGPHDSAPPSEARPKDPGKEFVAHVLGDTEDVWGAMFQAMGSRYEPPRLVLFRGAAQSACGRASAAVGPFYCPGDRKLYLDTAFFDELSRRFGAPGDFAQAYVIAHEVGHHVQNLHGTMRQFDQQMRAGTHRDAMRCPSGSSCRRTATPACGAISRKRRNTLEPGDLEEGFRAAAAVGDDQIQKRTQGYAVPESFTHGSAEQRLRWFRTGLESGDMRACDTFSVARL